MIAKRPISYAVIRGKVIDSDLIEFGGRGGDITFLAPDPHKIADRIPLASPRLMEDLYEISFEDILDYLAELGERLDIRKNDYLLEAREYSYATAPTTKPIMDSFFHDMPFMFDKERIRGMVDFNIGIPYLEGWVSKPINGSHVAIRAYGARTLHIVAGNGPVLGALTILRGAVTRGDTIIKVPSNDPFTTGAIARTMVDMAPDHPLTKHLAVAYWRGGDEALESKIYQPHHIEKICAWGGFASVKHVTKYIQPGIELISLDPKRSASIVGGEALESEQLIQEAASPHRDGCRHRQSDGVCRVPHGLRDLRHRRRRRGEAEEARPAHSMRPCCACPRRSRPNPSAMTPSCAVRSTRCAFPTILHSHRRRNDEGAVLVSHSSDRVEFWEYLADRTVNLIPVDTVEEVLEVIDAYTQTVGIFPEALREVVRHKGALHGGQRFVSLGYAFNGPGLVGPQDGIEPMRRIVKWIISEEPLPGRKPFWE